MTERISQPKAQPKSAANDKKKEAAGKASGSGARGRGGKRRAVRNSRPAKKTAEELDHEMADYFEAATENANGAVPATTNGDAPMEDEILVCSIQKLFSLFPLLTYRSSERTADRARV